MEQFSLSDWAASIGYALLGAIAGLLGHVMRETDEGNRLSWERALTEALSSGLVGFLVMLLCRAMGLDPLWSGFVVGIFGWLGASASIRLLERIVYERLGIKLRANTDKRIATKREEPSNEGEAP